MTFETATEMAFIADDDNRRGEPTQGLISESDMLMATDQDLFWPGEGDEDPFYVDPYELEDMSDMCGEFAFGHICY